MLSLFNILDTHLALRSSNLSLTSCESSPLPSELSGLLSPFTNVGYGLLTVGGFLTVFPYRLPV